MKYNLHLPPQLFSLEMSFSLLIKSETPVTSFFPLTFFFLSPLRIILTFCNSTFQSFRKLYRIQFSRFLDQVTADYSILFILVCLNTENILVKLWHKMHLPGTKRCNGNLHITFWSKCSSKELKRTLIWVFPPTLSWQYCFILHYGHLSHLGALLEKIPYVWKGP